MIMDSLDEYIETVSGYVFDNDKLVTYKWLSKELEVHVNVAKQILWEFRERFKDEKPFVCTFLLMGTLPDSGMRVEVVKEKDLPAAKEKFVKIVSKHIYSLQKALPEIQVLDHADNGDIIYSAIKCIENNVRSDEGMHLLRWGAASAEIQPQEPAKVQESIKEKPEKSPQKSSADTMKNAQKKGFNNLFGKVSTKQKSPSSSSSNVEKMDVDTSHNTKKASSKQSTSESSKKGAQKGGLSSFLQQGKSQGKATNSTSSETNKNINNHATISESPERKNTEDHVKQAKGAKGAKGRKRNRSTEDKVVAQKRKRIIEQSDSSDNGSSDEDQEDEMEIPPSPEKVSPVRIHSPSPPKVKHEGGKRKVLKLVDKTFQEDGYLVTKKVHVYESCSEKEEEVVEPKKSAPEPRAEQKGKKNTKQTTLMNFFKKP